MSALKIIIQAFLEICLLRKGPQDIPASSLFFGICAGTYALSGLLLATAYQDFNNAVITALADSGLTILITYLLLFIVRRPQRWLQTGTALLGTGTIFSLLATPVYYAIAAQGGGQSGSPVLSILIWVLIIWNVIVMAHILKHALSVSFPMGILVALTYIFIVSGTIISITPEQPI